MFNIWSKKNEKKYKFFTSYGYLRGAEKHKSNFPLFVQKAICPEIGAEIYKIGEVSGDFWPKGDIYVLVWNKKIIPFLLPSPLNITHKHFSAYVKRFHEEILVAEYKVPVASVTVIRVGYDLKKLPSGREYNTSYERYVFSSEDNHSYEFADHAEYEEILGVIKDGLPILLYDRYDRTSYAPIIPAEILFGVGPWNLTEEFYRKEREELNNSNGSLFRKLIGIAYLLDHEKKSSTSGYFKNLYKKAKKALRPLIRKFKKNVKTAQDFITFFETGLIQNQAAQSGELLKIGTHKTVFYKHIMTIRHISIKNFYAYKRALEAKAAEKHFEDIEKKTPKYININDFLNECSNREAKDISIEEIMLELIAYESGYHSVNEWRHGSTFFININILKAPIFCEIIKNLYYEHYKDFVPTYEQLLLTITETMVRRVSFRTAREKAEEV